MSFDWQQESKEWYFRIAEEQIEAAGFDGFIGIDRSQFGTVGNERVRVYTQPIHRNGNMRRWWEAKRTLENFHEVKVPRDQFRRNAKTIFLRGYFEIEMEGGDRE